MNKVSKLQMLRRRLNTAKMERDFYLPGIMTIIKGTFMATLLYLK